MRKYKKDVALHIPSIESNPLPSTTSMKNYGYHADKEKLTFEVDENQFNQLFQLQFDCTPWNLALIRRNIHGQFRIKIFSPNGGICTNQIHQQLNFRNCEKNTLCNCVISYFL